MGYLYSSKNLRVISCSGATIDIEAQINVALDGLAEDEWVQDIKFAADETGLHALILVRAPAKKTGGSTEPESQGELL